MDCAGCCEHSMKRNEFSRKQLQKNSNFFSGCSKCSLFYALEWMTLFFHINKRMLIEKCTDFIMVHTHILAMQLNTTQQTCDFISILAICVHSPYFLCHLVNSIRIWLCYLYPFVVVVAFRSAIKWLEHTDSVNTLKRCHCIWRNRNICV